MALKVTSIFDENDNAVQAFRNRIREREEWDKKRAEQATGEKPKWVNYDLKVKLNGSVVIHLLWPLEKATEFHAHNRYNDKKPKEWWWINRTCVGKNFPNHKMVCPLCQEAEADIAAAEADPKIQAMDTKALANFMGTLKKARAREMRILPVLVWESNEEYARGPEGGKFRYIIKPAPSTYEAYNPYGVLLKKQEEAQDLAGDETYDLLTDPMFDLKLSWNGPDTRQARYDLKNVRRKVAFDFSEITFEYPQSKPELITFVINQSYPDRKAGYADLVDAEESPAQELQAQPAPAPRKKPAKEQELLEEDDYASLEAAQSASKFRHPTQKAS